MLSTGLSAEFPNRQKTLLHWTARGFVADNVDHPGMSLAYPGNGERVEIRVRLVVRVLRISRTTTMINVIS